MPIAYHHMTGRNIEEHNRGLEQPMKMRYYVLVVDELADLMLQGSGKEIEKYVTLLAQKSRAVGIHLILATQRPSTDVMTGLIKANIPARLSFRVASKTDSRVILDRNGAENLNGRGDMLFLEPGKHDLTRIQGPYLSNQEIDGIVSGFDGAPTYAEDSIIDMVRELERLRESRYF